MHEIGTLRSVGSRVSWSAVLAGSLLGLAICLLLTTLGTAVGMSSKQLTLSELTIQNASIIWGLLIVCVSVFVGAMATSLLTVGETKAEGMLHGILVWAIFVGAIFLMGTMGVRHGWLTLSPADNIIIRNGDTAEELARRYAWLSFGCTWLSMVAAAFGAYLGAGPTFRATVVGQHEVLAKPVTH